MPEPELPQRRGWYTDPDNPGQARFFMGRGMWSVSSTLPLGDFYQAQQHLNAMRRSAWLRVANRIAIGVILVFVGLGLLRGGHSVAGWLLLAAFTAVPAATAFFEFRRDSRYAEQYRNLVTQYRATVPAGTHPQVAGKQSRLPMLTAVLMIVILLVFAFRIITALNFTP